MNPNDDLTRILDQETVARAHAIASRNAHMHELRKEIESLRARITFWKVVALGMTISAIACAVLAR